MKLSKIILSKKIVENTQFNLTESDISLLAETISSKLEDYIDVGNKELLSKAVIAAIEELSAE